MAEPDSMDCEIHLDLRRVYVEAADRLRLLMGAEVDALGSSHEPQRLMSAHGEVTYQQGKCNSILKALKAHVAKHRCAAKPAARAATHR